MTNEVKKAGDKVKCPTCGKSMTMSPEHHLPDDFIAFRYDQCVQFGLCLHDNTKQQCKLPCTEACKRKARKK